MPAAFPPDSVGLVTPQVAHFSEPLALACGRSLPAYDLVFETYGTLNATASNAVLICHALSGHHHAAGFHSPDDRQARLVGQLHRSRQANRHQQILRRQPEQPRRLQRLYRPEQHQPGNRQAIRRRFPGVDRGRLGAQPGAPGRSPRHHSVRRGNRWQPRRHAGDAMEHHLPRPYPSLPGHRLGTQVVGAKHCLQRSGAPGDPHRPGIPRWLVPGTQRDPQARADAGADGRTHHLSVRRFHGREIRSRPEEREAQRTTSTASNSRSKAICVIRARSSPGALTPTPTC